MTNYPVMSREKIEKLERAEIEALLDFMNGNSERAAVGKRNGYNYYRNYVKIHAPASDYTDLELKLILRLTQWVNGQRASMWFNPHVGGFDSGCAFITLIKTPGKTEEVADSWYGTKANWHGGETKRTLAQMLGVFYNADLAPGMWVAGPDLVAHEVVRGEGHFDNIELADVEGIFPWKTFPLAAPTETEMAELIEACRRDREMLGITYPLT